MLFIEANLGRHEDLAEFIANVRALDDEAGEGTVLGLIEIDEDDGPDEHGGLRRVLAAGSWTFAGWSTREPIALARKWRRLEEHVTKAAKGLVRLSPARTITEALIEHQNGAQLVVMCLHYPRKDPRLLLRWLRVRAVHKQRIRARVAQGSTVVWFSDVNRTRFSSLHPAERTLAHQGLDWIRCVEAPGGARIKVLDTGVVDLTIDGHNAPWARVAITKGKS